MSKQFIALAVLRRDVMILGSGTQAEIEKLATDATSQGRAAEVFVVPVAGYFSESQHEWNGLDTYQVGVAPAGIPVATPGVTGEAPPTGDGADLPVETPETNAQDAIAEQHEESDPEDSVDADDSNADGKVDLADVLKSSNAAKTDKK